MPYVCSIIDHRRPQNVGKNQKVMHSDVICDLLLNRRTVTCRLFLEYPLMDHFLDSRKLSVLQIIKVWRISDYSWEEYG